MQAGWTYLRVPEPSGGQLRLVRVVREDGLEIAFGTNAWTTDRTFLGLGRRPMNENILHLLDFNSAGTYSLHYVVPPAPDTNAPVSAVSALPASSPMIFQVQWSGADQGDTTTILPTVVEATSNLRELADDEATQDKVNEQWMSEIVADKGYHSNQALLDLQEMNLRSYVSEPNRGRRDWEDKADAKQAVYANRRRCRGQRGRRLMRSRGELIERSFAHAYETGAMRRTHLRHHNNILKRLLVHTAGFNLALTMRKLYGVGKPRRLQGLFLLIWAWIWTLLLTLRRRRSDWNESEPTFAPRTGLLLVA